MVVKERERGGERGSERKRGKGTERERECMSDKIQKRKRKREKAPFALKEFPLFPRLVCITAGALMPYGMHFTQLNFSITFINM